MGKELPLVEITFFLIVGTILGMILMASIYNLMLYLYHKQKSFLYYALMQMGLIIILLYDTNIIHLFFPEQYADSPAYQYISYATLIFIVMFAREFLQIPKYNKKHDFVLKAILLFMFVDMVAIKASITFSYGGFVPIFIYILYLGFNRVKKGHKPAKFFLLGWGLFAFSLFLDSFSVVKIFVLNFYFNVMFVGVVLEAIVLAVAISYQFKELQKEQESLLFQQSKLASMGELLGNIAHQWRQPLTRLSYTLMNIETEESKSKRALLFHDAFGHIEFMSQTIDDFKNFYSKERKKESFSLAKEAKRAIELIDNKGIEISLEVDEDKEVFHYKNDYRQILINLISNAIEALTESKTEHPRVVVAISPESVSVKDNGPGIEPDKIDRIFEPYYTTKEDGMGIGLYISNVIANKHLKWRLEAKSSKDGAVFVLHIA